MKNIHTQSEQIPEQIDGTYPPTREQLLAAGWRDVPPVPPIADGYTRTVCTFADGDGVTGQWQVTDRLTSELEAEARAAKLATLTPELISMATLYRATLRAYFGANAETNQAVTERAVSGLFLAKMAGAYGGMTDQDRDALQILEHGFSALSAWNGSPETWTFPWGDVP